MTRAAGAWPGDPVPLLPADSASEEDLADVGTQSIGMFPKSEADRHAAALIKGWYDSETPTRSLRPLATPVDDADLPCLARVCPLQVGTEVGTP